jgi:hypothetical protein
VAGDGGEDVRGIDEVAGGGRDDQEVDAAGVTAEHGEQTGRLTGEPAEFDHAARGTQPPGLAIPALRAKHEAGDPAAAVVEGVDQPGELGRRVR